LSLTQPGAELVTNLLGTTALTYYQIIGWVIAACGAAVIFLGPKAAATSPAVPPHQQSMPQGQRLAAPQGYGGSPQPQQYMGERRCPSCGRTVPAGKNFCTGCGTRLA
jgi:hypothetical protein